MGVQPSRKPVAADIKMFTAIPPSCLPRCSSLIIYTRWHAQYHSLHKNTNIEKRQMVLTYLRVQSLHASSALISSCSITCSCDYLIMSIIYIYFMHLSIVNCVDVDAYRMLNYEMWFYDVSKLRRHL